MDIAESETQQTTTGLFQKPAVSRHINELLPPSIDAVASTAIPGAWWCGRFVTGRGSAYMRRWLMAEEP
jgi:hypothetical protein